jgi:class 3 adenylate cyclase
VRSRSSDLAERLFERIGALRSRSDPDKCLFAASVFLIATLCYGALWVYSATHPEFEPYVNHAVLRVLLPVQAASLFVWVMLLIASVVVRRRRTRSPGLVVAHTVIITCQLAYTSYVLGPYTNPFFGLTITALWVSGLICLDRQVLTIAMVCQWLLLLGMTVAEQAHLIPYAPLYSDAPVQGAHLHPSWLVGPGALMVVMMLFVQFVIYGIIDRWRERENALALTSEQLARANDVISRYVASQLAEQVRTGNYTDLERHERRRLTLFFSDIENFAATADLMEPEDLSARLNEYLSEMTVIAERHGATIDKFVGDAIMIFFGAPEARIDREQALHAVRMAIEMQRRLSELRQQWRLQGMEKPFRVRMGINTGQATVGAFGSETRLEYTAIGRQVNLAARLQAQCEPDGILLSQSTWALIQEEIPCRLRGEIALKGFHQPVPVYEVVTSDSGR